MKLYSNYNRFKSPIQMKMCHVIASIGIKMPKIITLFSIHVNTMFGFISRNYLIPIETKSVHVNVTIVIKDFYFK